MLAATEDFLLSEKSAGFPERIHRREAESKIPLDTGKALHYT
jgi:hypothetical protein